MIMPLVLGGLCRWRHRSGDCLHAVAADMYLYICDFGCDWCVVRQIIGIGRHNHSYIELRRLVVARKRKPDAKEAALAETRTLKSPPGGGA
jgi:hypothetical protein